MPGERPPQQRQRGPLRLAVLAALRRTSHGMAAREDLERFALGGTLICLSLTASSRLSSIP
jgi:hypothetical protein